MWSLQIRLIHTDHLLVQGFSGEEWGIIYSGYPYNQLVTRKVEEGPANDCRTIW